MALDSSVLPRRFPPLPQQTLGHRLRSARYRTEFALMAIREAIAADPGEYRERHVSLALENLHKAHKARRRG